MKSKLKYNQPDIIQLPKIIDPRGNLSFIESEKQVPFIIERVYWIYDVPGGEKRGGHAYYNLQEFIIALSGSFDVVLNDGKTEYKFNLNRSYYGLYIPSMFWRSLENFSTNSVALVLADADYDEANYIRDFNRFELLKNGK
jgi:hypothetical protein